MRKFLALLLLLAMAGGGYVLFMHGNRVNAPLGVMLNGQTREVTELGRQFMEAVQYKDFKAAALLSPPADREKADIPKLIERLFLVKPEQLQIDKVQLLTADVDSTGARARTKFGTDVKLLNSQELRHPEIMLYWHKATDGKWYMDLASSLQ
ncbi:MAG: hypothetical protein JWM80_4408 [Cyanobacteria bacterium RYN_339]|nr:hypothetical protein [Cyanobacteria bacterium RYN_339]